MFKYTILGENSCYKWQSLPIMAGDILLQGEVSSTYKYLVNGLGVYANKDHKF